MAASFPKSLALFLALNLVFFTVVSACGECGSGSPKPKHKPSGGSSGSGSSPSTGGGSSGSGSSPSTGGGSSGSGSSPSTGGGSSSRCPRDALKLGVCANVLNLIKLNIGNPDPNNQCCPLIQGLIDAQVGVCLCTTISAGILGINLNIPVDLSLLVNFCNRSLPRNFQCS